MSEGADVEITDEYMQEQLAASATYTVALMYRGPRYDDDGARELSRTTGEMSALRAQGVLDVVMPLPPKDGVAGPLRGLAIFSVPPEEVRALLDVDPAVEAGVLTYELHEGLSFPGDALRTPVTGDPR